VAPRTVLSARGHSHVVGELVARFECDWAQARPWNGLENAQVTPLGALSQVQQDVLLGLVGGATHKVLGQRLRMSLRQIERAIDEIKRVIDPSGAPVSAAQMGHWCARMEADMQPPNQGE
jgi:hypothetical protein